MKLISLLTAASLACSTLIAAPVLAEAGRGDGHHKRGDHSQQERRSEPRRYDQSHRSDHRKDPHKNARKQDRADHGLGRQQGFCPPGLAKKDPRCQPPGQAHKQASRHDHDQPRRYGPRVGERLRAQDYAYIRDPGRYDLPTRDNWRYYQDGNQVYRVDSETQQILAVVTLLSAFFN